MNLILMAVMGGIILEVAYALLRAYLFTWWLWIGGFALIFMVMLANLWPVLIAPLFNKYVPLGDEHADLAKKLVSLADRAGMHVAGVFKYDMSRRTKAANAELDGLGNTWRITLSDTLIAEFTEDEIETVLGHELGHHVNRDIPQFVVAICALILSRLYLSSLGLRWGAVHFSLVGPTDIAFLPVLAQVMNLCYLIALPLGNGYFRWREREADLFAVKITGKRDAFASAMTRIANQNLSDVDPEPWVVWLLHSHPALGKRTAAARDFEER